jgi:hypothetical protein
MTCTGTDRQTFRVLQVAQPCLCRYLPRRLLFLTSFDSASFLMSTGSSSYPYFVWFVRLSSFLPLFDQFLFLSSVGCLFLSLKARLTELRRATICFVMSVCLSLDELSWNLYFSKICGEIQVSLKLDKSNGYFSWRPTYNVIISRLFHLRMRNVSQKICRENQNTHFMLCNFSFENRAVCEIMWKK